MRPVLLDMNGFACFREPTRVDFTDADYFALVGPTGSGKSTVVDAMTFALYGSVPRWGRKGGVSFALAPTTARGTVRLVFDIGGQRYVVARELRRATTGVQQRNARLERLADPAGVGAPDEATDVLAADGKGVTEAVERLLGLSFENFCQCVVLPQGQFAEFLRATPGDRQAILLKLLGAEHYEAIAKRVNQRAGLAAQRVTLLAEQLAGFADATENAEDAARKREESLGILVRQVQDMLPEISAAGEALAEAQEEQARLASERATLAALRVPDGVAELDLDLTAARDALVAARTVESDALVADTVAREALAAAPVRAPLEQVRRHHDEQAKVVLELPGARATRDLTAQGLKGADDAVSAAERTVEEARSGRDAAEERAAGACATVERLMRERQLLDAVAVPDGLPELNERARRTRVAVTAAQAAVEKAEQDDADARAALEQAPARGPLEHALRGLGELADVEARIPELAATHEAAVAARRAAEQDITAGTGRVEVARQARDAALRVHTAGALRPHLVAGEPCPVCEQPVTTLPPALDAPALAAAEDAVEDAEQALIALRAAEGKAARDEARAAADLDAATAQAERLSAELEGTAKDSKEITAALTRLDELTVAARAVAARSLAARDSRREVQTEFDQVCSQLTAARTELRAARDPLVALGAPSVDDTDLLAAWTALITWAGAQARSREEQMPAAQTAETAAEDALTKARVAFATAETELTRLRNQQTVAVKRAEKADMQLMALEARLGELIDLLREAPTEADAKGQLARLDTLEAAARGTDEKLRAARSARERAQRAVDDLAAEVSAAWVTLRSVRDPLVALGARELGQEDLLAEWTTLRDWAVKATQARAAELPGALERVTAARAAYDEMVTSLAEKIARHDVELPSGELPSGELATTATAAVTGAHERARAATARILERRGQLERLTAEHKDAETEQQVAKMLGELLRSDKFPRWLATAALDTLVLDASASLAELSGGQFELTHDRGEFFVIDHADADSQRSVRTLSGGETFQASLALALALSAQMSTLAAASAARLDSIFLDEGFGTLDPDTLEVVATTLENLARGERMVGVITHVAALAERVPVRFSLRRDARTSTVVRVSG